MATVIDALIITLGFDTKGLKQGQAESNKAIDDTKKKTKELTDQETKRDKEIKKRHEENKKRTKETSDGFKTLSKDALAFLGVVTTATGAAKFIGDITNTNAQLQRTATNLGSTTESLSAWGGAVERMGGNSQEAINTMQMLSQSMTQVLLTGDSPNLPFLRQLGVDMIAARKAADPLAEILKQMAEGTQANIAKVGRENAFNILGMAGVDYGMANIMMEGRKGLNLLLQKQKEIGVVIGDNARRSQELATQWVELRQRGRSLGLDIESVTTPALTRMLKRLMDFSKENPKIVAGVAGIAAVFLTKFAPVRALMLGIGALLAFDDWQTWKEKGESVIGSLVESFNELSASVKNAWYASQGAFDEKSKAEIDEKTTEKVKKWLAERAKKEFAAIQFLTGTDNESTVSKGRGDVGFKKTGKQPEPIEPVVPRAEMSDKEIIKYLMDRNYTRREAKGMIKTAARVAGRAKNGNVDIMWQMAKKEEAIAQDPNHASTKQDMKNARAAENHAWRGVPYSPNSSTTTNSTTISSLNVYTQATDALGIAKTLPRVLANQAESGAF